MARDNKKWFKQTTIAMPNIVHVTEDVSEEQLVEFFQELERIGLSEMSINLLRSRASLPKLIRLSVNIKSLIEAYSRKGEIHNVTQDGLSAGEELALYDLALRNADPETVVIAHSLLHIQERYVLQQVLNPLYLPYKIDQRQEKE